MFKDTIMKPSGLVTTTLTRADGSLINQVQTNTFTLVGAERLSAALAGEAGTLTVTSIQTSSGGPRLYDFDSTTGFTGTATVDSGVYKQGVGAFKIEAAPSGTQYVYDATTISSVSVPTSSSVELWMRLTTVTRVDKSASQLRVFSAGNASSYYGISLANLETAAGVTFADATWAQCRVPISSFNVTAGAPSWSDTTGIGLSLVAGTAGTATVYIDNAFIVNGNLDVTSAATAVPSVYDTKAVTRSRTTRTVTSSATWQLADAIGETFYVLGLLDGSSNLLAITGYAAGSGIYKEPNSILNVSWALTTTA
jgi:hypothetical protein